MTKKPGNRWFQIHLSTAILLMLTSGTLIWANLAKKVPFNTDGSSPGFTAKGFWISSGWPLTWWGIYENDKGERELCDLYLNGYNFLINLGAAPIALLLVWIISEWWIRRRVPHETKQ